MTQPKLFHMQARKPCPHCKGSGYASDDQEPPIELTAQHHVIVGAWGSAMAFFGALGAGENVFMAVFWALLAFPAAIFVICVLTELINRE